SAGAGGVELRVAGGFFGFGLPPVVPAFGPDDRGHFGVEEDGAGVDAPGSAEIGFYFRRASDFAVGEHETVGLYVGRRSGGDIAVAQAMDVAFLEKGGGGAEDEIHVAGDVAVLKIMAAAIGENGVLPAEEAAMAEDGAVAVKTDGEGLAD